MRSYDQDTDSRYVCTVTLTLEIWPWHKVMTRTRVMDNNRWNIIQIQLGSEELWPWHGFSVYASCNLDLWDMSLCQGHDTTLGHGQQLCEILSRSNFAVRSCGPNLDFGYVWTVTLTLEIWPWDKVMTHPWAMGNNRVKYFPDPTVQWGVMARTRILGMFARWPWLWRYDFGSRSWHTLRSWTIIVWNIIQIQQVGQRYGSDTKWTDGQTDGETRRETDEQTGWFLYTPNLCLRGYK